MKINELKSISESLIDTFYIAGKESVDLYAKGLKIEIKEDNSPVSNGDLRVNELITNKIKELTPNIPIVSEETVDLNIKNTAKIFWLIDPIDGTTNFLHGIPHFAISIALKSNNEIVSGLIYDPIKDEIFYAEKNNGAYFNNQRIRVSKKKELSSCLFSTGGKDKQNNDLNIRRSGSAALDMAYVAAGRYDGYFQYNLNLWDIAAGIVLIKEAGGIINDINLSVNQNIKVIASSPDINDKLIKKLNNF